MTGFHVHPPSIQSFSDLMYQYGNDVNEVRKYLVQHRDEFSETYGGIALMDIAKYLVPPIDVVNQLINDVTTCYHLTSSQLESTGKSYESIDQERASQLDQTYPGAPR
ncbi:hypothetical protein [Saccharopolyspora taberi]|uniref:Uncharacterized protein n=1 Tax=Saccharopolyspora taberi TaxID=60895 RepID=A0ABN3V042_9PSEU